MPVAGIVLYNQHRACAALLASHNLSLIHILETDEDDTLTILLTVAAVMLL